jgi:hypothetical protein
VVEERVMNREDAKDAKKERFKLKVIKGIEGIEDLFNYSLLTLIPLIPSRSNILFFAPFALNGRFAVQSLLLF